MGKHSPRRRTNWASLFSRPATRVQQEIELDGETLARAIRDKKPLEVLPDPPIVLDFQAMESELASASAEIRRLEAEVEAERKRADYWQGLGRRALVDSERAAKADRLERVLRAAYELDPGLLARAVEQTKAAAEPA